MDITALRSVCDLTITVDLVSGTSPTLDVTIETSADGTNWRAAGTHAQIIASGVYTVIVGSCSQYVRASWVIGGTDTPSFTFGVAGTGEVVYVTVPELASYGMSADVLDHIDDERRLRAVLSATATAASNLSAAFTLPLASWGRDVTSATARLAVYDLASTTERVAMDDTMVENKDDAMKFLMAIGTGRLRPTTIIDATPEVEEDSAYITSQPSRGWV